MAIIDSTIIMPALEEPENDVRAQNEADDAWVIMGTWVPNLLSDSGLLSLCSESDTPIRLQINKIRPCNLSTTTPLVINRVTIRLTLPRRLIPASATKNTSKNSKERSSIEVTLQMNDSSHKLGSHKPMNGETVLDRLI